MSDEMINLRRALDARGVEWQNASDNLDRSFPFLNLIIYRTHWTYNGHRYSAICGLGTWGGDKGLLEMWADWMDDHKGSLTATEVLQLMEDNDED